MFEFLFFFFLSLMVQIVNGLVFVGHILCFNYLSLSLKPQIISKLSKTFFIDPEIWILYIFMCHEIFFFVFGVFIPTTEYAKPF